MEQVDLVIVGAGIAGLTCASTYHRLHPSASILILDAAPSIGGPWAPHRTFPGLKTNNLLGMYEHPDFPMDSERFGVQPGQHIPAAKMYAYLLAMIDEFNIADFLRLNTAVNIVEKTDNGWILHCTSPAPSNNYKLSTPKLILASGNTNKPKIPIYPTSPAFTPLVLHSKDFPANYEQIVQQGKHTLVIGAGKSAWDISYACATQPHSIVTLLLRPSGNGPQWISPSHVTPLTLWLEKLVFTRFFGFMSPCPWARSTGVEGLVRRFLHRTWLGRHIVRGFWKVLGDDVVSLNKLRENEETRKLVPWRDAFEVGNCLSIHNYPSDFFQLVREGRIRVVLDEVAAFGEGGEVRLKSGEKVEVDNVVCATGWDVCNTMVFKPDGIEKDLGLPTTSPPSHTEASLIQTTTATLLQTFPILARTTNRTNHPIPSLRSTPAPAPQTQPYRLHRFIVPPSTLPNPSIAFACAMYCLGTFPLAYIQSLWITAYFHHQLAPLPSSSKILEDMYRDTEYCVLRSKGGYGRAAPDVVFDSLPYFDRLLGDLGVEGRRKGWGREWGEGYGPEDWRGVLGEWVEKMERGVGGGGGKKDV